MSDKLYDSKVWLHLMYVEKKLTALAIAKRCKVDESTIYRALVKHGIISK